jgi:DNA-binding MarR family transcriptional regulator
MPRRCWRYSQAFAYNRAAVTKKAYTAKQGQYLAFIFYYTKIHGRAPAESDMQNYFKVSPPSVHQMVLTLELNGFIERVPGQGRSIRLPIPREKLPDLE